jgi:putative redox protein
MKIQLQQVSTSASEAALRSHRVLIDRPNDRGGTDSGPMGGELFLASIGGCFMSTLLAAIRARNADVSNVRAEVIGTIAETLTRVSSMELNVEAQGSTEEIARLVAIADKGCMMMNTLRGVLDVRIRIGAAI